MTICLLSTNVQYLNIMKCSWGLVDTRGGGQEKIFYKLRIICWWSEELGWAEWVDQVTTTRLEIVLQIENIQCNNIADTK